MKRIKGSSQEPEAPDKKSPRREPRAVADPVMANVSASKLRLAKPTKPAAKAPAARKIKPPTPSPTKIPLPAAAALSSASRRPRKAAQQTAPPKPRKTRRRPVETAPAPVAAPIVTTLEVTPRVPRPKKPKPLAAAHLRGRRDEYDFEVWPLEADLPEGGPAVYVISRRQIDRNGRAHHKLVLIGESETPLKPVRKLRRDRLVKSTRANVVCIARIPDAGDRAAAVRDILDAHANVASGG